MAKDDKNVKPDITPQASAAAAASASDPTLPPRAAPPPPGIFDELARFTKATVPGEQRHTFGAWCRAKGVKMAQIQLAIKEGRVPEITSGDGPEMSEAEFDAAVDFRLSNTFGELPGQRIHVPADVARLGGTSKGLPEGELEPGAGGGDGPGGASSGGKREV